MRAHTSLLGARSLLVLGAITHAGALASPSINVALRASFNAAPYLVELLETSAEENSTAYFPLLDRIANGYFAKATTDEELYTSFLDLLKTDGHITDPAGLSSFQFALSVRSAAPRIEAHYQFYDTSVEPSLQAEQGADCETWVAFEGKQYCSPQLETSHGDIKSERTYELPFDRVLGDSVNDLPSILYADITSPSFASFHKTLSKTAHEGKTSYRVRHKPSRNAPKSPLVVNGYGVELQLKRTDYIVIDDRNAEQGDKDAAQKPIGTADTTLHDDEEVTDLKPLSKDEVSNLGLKAASFVMKSEQPFDTLLRLAQDFPKHSSAIVAHEASEDFVNEHTANREQLLPEGYNIMWINGVKIPDRDINPFTLLEHLRRERSLIRGVQKQGLSGPDAISLLSHSAITETQSADEPQRYDFRDATEGGKVIIWMNNIEKDSRYEGWSTSLATLLQRTYPGQLPSVRRDIHNAIIPIDFTSKDDVFSVTETITGLVKRGVPVRWGLVPKIHTEGAIAQARVVYYLLNNYGLSAVINYLDASSEGKALATPDKAIFESTVKKSKLRKNREVLEFDAVLNSHQIGEYVFKARRYLGRLAADSPNPPMFINGVPVAQGDNWLQLLSQRVSADLQTIQRAIFEEQIQEDAWVPQTFLAEAAFRRNPFIIPENDKEIALVDMAEFHEAHGHVLSTMPSVPPEDDEPKRDWGYLLVIADFDADSSRTLLQSVVDFKIKHQAIEVVVIHNPAEGAEQSNLSECVLSNFIREETFNNGMLNACLFLSSPIAKTPDASVAFWKTAEPIFDALDLSPGQAGLLLNGRYVAIPEGHLFTEDEFETLYAYEVKKRIEPLAKALEDLKLTDKIASALDVAKIQSIVALSTISDVPEGIFETASTLRTEVFKVWADAHTAIVKGDNTTASIQIVAVIDPATELAQKWIPILKTLSEMDGVHLKLFLNPRRLLQELPVKRFYRYLLGSKPTFNKDGSVGSFEAHFSGIPKEALFNLGMDVPPSWLVAPEDSIHDLDNIKLSSLSAGANIDAIYGLESILIEGHSRDVTNSGQPPKGAEVVLATEKNPHFADTIIMANLGYFQFKANPGFYNIQLKSGRSQEIFTIDSAGSKGWAPQPNDETSEIVLMSFQGTTLFPRLSRQPGKEEADVLEVDEGLAAELVGKGSKKVDQLLGKIGLGGFNTEKVLKKGADLLSGGKNDKKSSQAEINIFSVASGHLYERMLNIMMLSVMKHTKHTVKFWFIEQFLSPSFKTFLPSMAAEYGFKYEMVTYKWPHWLRGQTEKQREIWGYKILFLDVLFPLDLDKVIFVDADQIVRTDMYELVTHDLEGAPYGFTPMCDSRVEMEGFRFWKTGYWANFLRGRPYHISALYVVDLKRFRQMAAGDRLRQQYHSLSADPGSLANLDQDLPNNMQFNLPIHSLPQHWLWCETWCSDESLKEAKTIDLCNNPQTKEPKLDRARRQVPEWTVYDEEIAGLARRAKGEEKKEDKKKAEEPKKGRPGDEL